MTAPYYAFLHTGMDIDVASIRGGMACPPAIVPLQKQALMKRLLSGPQFYLPVSVTVLEQFLHGGIRWTVAIFGCTIWLNVIQQIALLCNGSYLPVLVFR